MINNNSLKSRYIDIDQLILDGTLLFYLCILFAHQNETQFERFLRYGSLGLVVMVYLIYYGRNWAKIVFDDTKRWVFIAWFLLFIAYGAMSSLWAIDTMQTLKTAYDTFKIFMVCVVLIPRFQEEEDIKRGYFLVLIALLYTAAVLLLKTPVSDWGMERVGEVINRHSIDIGRMMNLGAIVSMYFCSSVKGKKWIYGAFVGLFYFVAFLTGSKTALLMMVFLGGLYLLFISNRYRKILVTLVVLFGALLMFWFIMTNTIMYELVGRRFVGMIEFLSGSGGDGSTRERMFFMRNAWELFLSYPVVGSGWNNFSSYMSSIFYSNAKYSHCGFLEVLSTLGIIGAGLYYSVYFLIISKLTKYAKNRHKFSALSLVCVASFFFFDICTISVYTGYSYIFLLLAFAECCALKKQKIIRNDMRKELRKKYLKSIVELRMLEQKENITDYEK